MMAIIEQLRRELATRETEATRLRAAIAALDGIEPATTPETAARLGWQETWPVLDPVEPVDATRAAQREANLATMREWVLNAVRDGHHTREAIAEHADLLDEDVETALRGLIEDGLVWHETTGGEARFVVRTPEEAEAPLTDDERALIEATAPKAKTRRPRAAKAKAAPDDSALHDAIARQIADAGEGGCKASVIREANGLSKSQFATVMAAMTDRGMVTATGRNNGTRYRMAEARAAK